MLLFLEYLKTKEFASLSRLKKGYLFEMILQELLKLNGITFKGNPKDFNEWCKKTSWGHDIEIEGIFVEAKCLLRKLELSWFRRDWLSRSASIFVTNDKSLIPYRAKRMLAERHIKLMTPEELVNFFLKRRRVTNPIGILKKLYMRKNGSSVYFFHFLCSSIMELLLLSGFLNRNDNRILPKALSASSNIGSRILNFIFMVKVITEINRN
ncbi:MAG: hypothetical protein QXP38_03290 [Nitrososphaerota archaeon]